MAEVPKDISPDCIDLDYRFAATVMPNPEEAAELVAQDQCLGQAQGETCYFRLSDPSEARCRYQSSQIKKLGGLFTQATFNQIVRPLSEGDNS